MALLKLHDDALCSIAGALEDYVLVQFVQTCRQILQISEHELKMRKQKWLREVLDLSKIYDFDPAQQMYLPAVHPNQVIAQVAKDGNVARDIRKIKFRPNTSRSRYREYLIQYLQAQEAHRVAHWDQLDLFRSALEDITDMDHIVSRSGLVGMFPSVQWAERLRRLDDKLGFWMLFALCNNLDTLHLVDPTEFFVIDFCETAHQFYHRSQAQVPSGLEPAFTFPPLTTIEIGTCDGNSTISLLDLTLVIQIPTLRELRARDIQGEPFFCWTPWAGDRRTCLERIYFFESFIHPSALSAFVCGIQSLQLLAHDNLMENKSASYTKAHASRYWTQFWDEAEGPLSEIGLQGQVFVGDQPANKPSYELQLWRKPEARPMSSLTENKPYLMPKHSVLTNGGTRRLDTRDGPSSPL